MEGRFGKREAQGNHNSIVLVRRGSTGEFSCAKAEKKFWFHVRNKIEAKKRHESQFVPPPKSAISTLPKYQPLDPCNIIIAALLGRDRGFGNAVARGAHLCVRLRRQKRVLATPGRDKAAWRRQRWCYCGGGGGLSAAAQQRRQRQWQRDGKGRAATAEAAVSAAMALARRRRR